MVESGPDAAISAETTPGAGLGQHYSVAYPEWAEKPFNFADFSRAARFANSLTNGTVLSRIQSTSHGFKYVTYTLRLSPRTEQGMYDVNNPATTRAKSTGFVIPSNNEWVKAAYYDPRAAGPTCTGRTRPARSTSRTLRC